MLTPNNETGRQHVTPLTTGFYVALKGVPQSNAKLLIVYSAFSYKDCLNEANFLCKNQRCISILLYCDGFDHCGDNSDEPTSCKRSFVKALPGFYELRTTAAVFVVCSLGI